MSLSRPKFFYDPEGNMPEEVELTFTIPKVWDAEPEDLRTRIEQECNRREEEVRERFRKEGKEFLGVKKVLRQPVSSSPKTRETWFGLVPHVACKDTSLRVKFLAWRKRRQMRYNQKRAAMLEGKKDSLFPEGTYWLHFFCGQSREPWLG